MAQKVQHVKAKPATKAHHNFTHLANIPAQNAKVQFKVTELLQSMYPVKAVLFICVNYARLNRALAPRGIMDLQIDSQQ